MARKESKSLKLSSQLESEILAPRGTFCDVGRTAERMLHDYKLGIRMAPQVPASDPRWRAGAPPWRSGLARPIRPRAEAPGANDDADLAAATLGLDCRQPDPRVHVIMSAAFGPVSNLNVWVPQRMSKRYEVWMQLGRRRYSSGSSRPNPLHDHRRVQTGARLVG